MDALMRTTLQSERGTTLIETMIALGILLTVMGGLITLSAVSAKTTENNGHLAARTTEDAQDKMEQLQALTYGDAVTDTTVFPAAAGGTGLSVGGSSNPAAPVVGYVDWLAADGTLLGGGVAAPNGWFYERVWQVSNLVANVKQITVTVTTRWAFNGANAPSSTVVALKANF